MKAKPSACSESGTVAAIHRRPGFTVIEVLVTIAVIGILLAILLPAVQHVRESGRRTQCLSRLRQIGLALHHYHDSHSVLPPAVIWSGPPGEPLGLDLLPVGTIDRVATGVAPGSEPDRVHANWALMLLPHLDQSVLASAYDPFLPVNDPANAQVRNTKLAVLLCPSDSLNDRPYDRGLQAGNPGFFYARGNYAFNFGPNNACFSFDPVCEDGFQTDSDDFLNEVMWVWGSGIGGVNVSFHLRQFRGGTSNMVAIDEIRAGISPLDPRGTWALGMAGASITVRHGKYDLGNDGPINSLSPSADDIVSCGELTAEFGADGLLQLGMPCSSNIIPANHQATARSRHPGGVQVLMLDGSAHFVSENISTDVWHAMHSKDTTEQVSLPF